MTDCSSWVRRRPAAGSVTCKLRLQRDLRAGERTRHGASVLCLLGQRRKRVGVDSGDVAHRPKGDARDRKPGVELLEPDLGRRLQVGRRVAGLGEQVGQRHREAAGVRGADQLLRIGRALDVVDPSAERERALVGAAAPPDPATALGQVSLPARRGGACDADAHGRVRVSQLTLRLRYALGPVLPAGAHPTPPQGGSLQIAQITDKLDVDAARKRFSSLQQGFMFFDAPGGSQVPDEVGDAIARTLREASANLGAGYETSRRVGRILEQAEAGAARFLGCEPHEVIFGANMTSLDFALSRTAGREFAAATRSSSRLWITTAASHRGSSWPTTGTSSCGTSSCTPTRGSTTTIWRRSSGPAPAWSHSRGRRTRSARWLTPPGFAGWRTTPARSRGSTPSTPPRTSRSPL